jgi:hypothetical protein
VLRGSETTRRTESGVLGRGDGRELFVYLLHLTFCFIYHANVTQILTMRPMMFIIAFLIVSPLTRTFYGVGTCKWVLDVCKFKGISTTGLGDRYPTCFGGLNGDSLLGDGEALVVVRTGFAWPEQRAVTMNMTFGTSGWFALVVHILMVEWWLSGDSAVVVKAKGGGFSDDEVKAKKDALKDDQVLEMKI